MDPMHTKSVPARLTLWDAISIILGIIIGVGIFKTPSDVFQSAPGPEWAIAVWLIGGLLALAGAFCFAELASAYPRSGGEYVYLTRSFGALTGYMFAWAQLAVIRPGGIGAMAYVFAHFGAGLWGFGGAGALWLSIGAVVALTLINVLGVTLGKNTQNLLTLAKVAGLIAIVFAGFAWSRMAPAADAVAPLASAAAQPGWFALAMIFVLWTYSGWHEAAYVASEVKDRQRNLPRALILGTVAVTAIYLLVNVSLWQSLGYEGAKSPTAIRDMVAGVLPAYGAEALSVLVMVSALGALNGMIFTTARIYSEFGADHRLFQPLAHWSRRFGTPARALMTQGVIALALILGIALIGAGREGVDRETVVADAMPVKGVPVETVVEAPPVQQPDHAQRVEEGFKQMVAVTAAAFWMFFFLTGLSLFVLRIKDPETERPFRVPFYPWLPLVFCAWCVYMMYGAIVYKPWLSLLSLLILAGGLPFYYWPRKTRRRVEKVERETVGQA